MMLHLVGKYWLAVGWSGEDLLWLVDFWLVQWVNRLWTAEGCYLDS